ncbi:ribose-5-phosphate isomerase RpiA [Spirochaeta cellobiosiphila]|uniref:ribose-5-phosphate isomerase RpiA n=1 Tax=Spirochaeta cellobiosiphila TaxID=504483 RepID=UPI000490EABF|nr:ribose-5-phosphate isomerase RpiA [Spirochaeta cellobiosiphila]
MKQNVGYAAVDQFIKSGMKIGMGTGSTSLYAVERLIQKVKAGEITDIYPVATSFQTEFALQQAGIPVYTLNSPEIEGKLDVAIDGADAIDPQLCLIKGAGAAQLIEKIVESSAEHFIVIGDESKLVESLGSTVPVPLEILPAARQFVINKLEEVEAQVTIREGSGKAGPVISDSGNIIADALWSEDIDPIKMDQYMNNIPGLVEHGLFCHMAKTALIGYQDGSVKTMTK